VSTLDDVDIVIAARRQRDGGLVALPTETVYGLAADASQREAVAAVYATKGRPADHPLIVHVLDAMQGARWADWSERATRLAQAFWPGPLTIVLERRAGAPAWACAGQHTIGLRAPAHPVARRVLRAFAALGGEGVAAPSANRFGCISPTTATHVIDDLGADAALVLDGGACEVGVESTIVDLSRGAPVLSRPGAVHLAALERVLGEPVPLAPGLRTPGCEDTDTPRAPGTLLAHYAPRTPLRLLDADALRWAVAEAVNAMLNVAAWVRDPVLAASATVTLPMPDSPAQCARVLYATLRRLDAQHCDLIVVQAPPREPGWQAVADRLGRAAAAHR
jgi:L-threonylcarbamoyladenylate synthase